MSLITYLIGRLGFPVGRRDLNRREFTKNICALILEMAEAGEQPILDYALRSEAEQMRLYKLGKSERDGVDKISDHQTGTAVDLYLCHFDGDGKVVVDFTWNKEKAKKWHDRWEEMGGKAVISWDLGHFGG